MYKSIVGINNVVYRLNQNNRNLVSFKDNKLTKLLQNSLGGNSKTTFICTIIDDSNHYNDTTNKLNFANKVKNLKNYYGGYNI